MFPPPGTLLRALPLPPLTEAAEVALRRARTFLWSAQQPAWQTRLLLSGYTPEQHAHGAYLASHVSGERTFDEWRLMRSFGPPSDPEEMAEERAVLEAFEAHWLARAEALIPALVLDEEIRREVLEYLSIDPEPKSCASRRVPSFGRRLRRMTRIPAYAPVWEQLVKEGIEPSLEQVEAATLRIREYIETAPFEPEELTQMGEAREVAGQRLTAWLADRARDLAALSPQDREVLALGTLVPPPGFEPPATALFTFALHNKA